MVKECIISLYNKWNTASCFEEVLQQSGDIYSSNKIIFRFPPDCKVKLDAAARLLSLANQLCSKGHTVKLNFEGSDNPALGYLNRANLLTLLTPNIVIECPNPPDPEIPNKFNGNTLKLVEFDRIHPGDNQEYGNLPSRLTDAFLAAIKPRVGDRISEYAVYTIFGELLSNVYEHSQTELDGYVAFQVYERGHPPTALVVVSDSGKGIFETLKPVLEETQFSGLSETELIATIFREGISSKGSSGGNGLKSCADWALRYEAVIDVRLPSSSVCLVPSQNGYIPSQLNSYSNLPHLDGTHISFCFPLDKI